MSIKPDVWIEHMACARKMIDPFEPQQVRINGTAPVVSYGLSSYGYDIRVGQEFRIFSNIHTIIIDPKNFNPASFVEFQGLVCTIPPNSFVLGHSIEYIRMPRNVTAIILGKSTYARCGIVTNFTPLEAGWAGHITIEISNTTPLPAKIYANEGIGQVIFFEGAACRTSYADRNTGAGGKYQGQTGITLPKV